jgi:hypothetical protein
VDVRVRAIAPCTLLHYIVCEGLVKSSPLRLSQEVFVQFGLEKYQAKCSIVLGILEQQPKPEGEILHAEQWHSLLWVLSVAVWLPTRYPQISLKLSRSLQPCCPCPVELR